MAKTRKPKPPKPPKPSGKAKPAGPSAVPVKYDLFALPTAFHKAGLAGLILLIESLKARQVLTADEAKYEMTATGAKVIFTENLVGKLFDDMYDAEPDRVRERKTGSRKKNAEAVDAEKKTKESPPIPKLTALRGMLPDRDETWVKLWRDMIFQVPRSQQPTWKPYKDRIAGLTYRLKNRDPWADLQGHEISQQNGRSRTGKLSGSLLLGIQEENPERIPCQGWLQQNLLLHFWPLTVRLFAPQQIKSERKNRELKITTEFVGFTLAVPDVSNLKEFVLEYPKLLTSLSKDIRKYRPAQAVIDLPSEGALAFLDSLAILTGLQVETGELRFSIGAVEYLHVFKQKRNVKTMAAGRVAPNRHLLSGYRAIACPKDESTRFRNSLFRRGLLTALFDGVPWYQPFGRAFSTFDEGVFMYQSPKAGEEKGVPQFATDAAKKFRHETKLFTQALERQTEMSNAESLPAPLPVLVEQVIRTYLLNKAKDKCNIKKETKIRSLTEDQKKEFYKKKRLIAKEAFQAAKSRRDTDFVGYFSSVICSAGTYFDRKSPDLQVFATALIDPTQTEAIKTLTLLALSANS